MLLIGIMILEKQCLYIEMACGIFYLLILLFTFITTLGKFQTKRWYLNEKVTFVMEQKWQAYNKKNNICNWREVTVVWPVNTNHE